MFKSLGKTKTATVVGTHPPKEITVDVDPEDTAAAIVDKAGLDPGTLLMMPGDEGIYAPTALPFEELPPKAKLHTVSDATVGRG